MAIGLFGASCGLRVIVGGSQPALSISSLPGTLLGGSSVTINYSAENSDRISTLSLKYAADGLTFTDVADLSVQDTSYSWTVPAGYVTQAKLKLVATSADGTTSAIESSAFTILKSADVDPAYPNHARLLQYVKANNGGTNGFDQPDMSCSASGDGPLWSACLHAGDRKKITLESVACSRLGISDALGAFDWTCDDTGSPTVIYGKLKLDRGLKDLIQDETRFKKNHVTITRDGTPYYQSEDLDWWPDNTITALPDNSTGSGQTLLGAPGTIYVLSTSRETAAYQLAANELGLVVLDGAVLSANGSTLSVGGYTGNIVTVNSDFDWVEGRFSGVPASGSNAQFAVYVTSASRFARLDWVEATGASSFEIDIFGSKGLYTHLNSGALDSATTFVADISGAGNKFYDVTSYGKIAVQGSHGPDYFEKISAGRGPAVYLGGSIGNQVVIRAISPANSGNPVVNINGSEAGAVVGFVSSVNGNKSIAAYNSNARIFQILGANESWDTVDVPGSNANNITLAQIAGAANGAAHVWISAGSSNLFLPGFFVDSSTGCASGTGTGNELDASCDYGPSLSAPTSIAIGPSTFVGALSTDDAANSSDLNGKQAFASIADWTHFENWFRGWGKEQLSAFPNTTQRGNCTTGNCQIYDWRLRTGASVWNVNGTFSDGDPCPASVSGADSNVQMTDAAGRTFLINAYEIFGDDIGNDNGLCESGEACIYAPNIGAYQGEESGDYTTKQCVFEDGAITGVRMYAYPVNGV